MTSSNLPPYTAAYVLPHPAKGAVGQRVLGISQGLLATGTVGRVHVLSPSPAEVGGSVEGVLHFPVEASPAKSRLVKAANRLSLGLGTVRQLERMTPRPDLVIVYGGGALYMSRIQRWARSHGVPIAADMVEWYDSSHLPMGRLGPLALDNRIMMTSVAARSDGILAISGYLTRHFTNTGARNVITVPPVADLGRREGTSVLASTTGPIDFVYCGDPGKKDRLDLAMRAAIKLDPLGERLRFTVAGPSRDDLATMLDLGELPPVINSVGRLSRDACLTLLKRAHWMPLVRDDERFAHAGFPTKVAEAMSLGVPVIANHTSDLAEVVVDGVTGIRVDRPTEAAVTTAFTRALATSSQTRAEMAGEALRLAHALFDYRGYVPQLRTWLASLMEEHSR